MLSTLLNQIKLVYGQIGQSNMHSTLDFSPRPARKERNVPLQDKLRAYCPKICIYCVAALPCPALLFLFITHTCTIWYYVVYRLQWDLTHSTRSDSVVVSTFGWHTADPISIPRRSSHFCWGHFKFWYIRS